MLPDGTIRALTGLTSSRRRVVLAGTAWLARVALLCCLVAVLAHGARIARRRTCHGLVPPRRARPCNKSGALVQI